MLYLNAYIVGRSYGGPEEGGWWYDAGQPLASIPLITVRVKGQSYYLSTNDKGETEVCLRTCQTCQGDGWVEEEDEMTQEVYRKNCEDCGEVPEDCLVVAKQIAQYQHMLSGEASDRHHERLMMAVQPAMAAPFPDKRPRYE